ncbi:MAG: HEPN domain-containing protein [Chloroflexi bacterium]|nr:HEPN domain-containing protein [Chloroflexota bacterium]
MPSPSPDARGVAEVWLARARGDLALASVPLPPGGFYEDLCYHAQQAAEKALKALYIRRGWPFRRVHDLGELLYGLRVHGLPIPDSVEEAVILTSYAVEARYPGLAEPVSAEEYEEAVRLAAQVVEWAAGVL